MNVQTKDGFSNDNGFNFVKEKVLTLIYLKWICPSFCMDKKYLNNVQSKECRYILTAMILTVYAFLITVFHAVDLNI